MCKNILIYNSGGGLGDSIQVIPVIESINKTFVNSKILYLGAHGNHFDKKLKDYNGHQSRKKTKSKKKFKCV